MAILGTTEKILHCKSGYGLEIRDTTKQTNNGPGVTESLLTLNLSSPMGGAA
jgi:hypothetical protein